MGNPIDRAVEWLIGVWKVGASREFQVDSGAVGTCLRWSRDIDRFGFASPSITYSENNREYRRDNLGGLAYTPWVFKKKVGVLDEADPRVWTVPREFRIQLVPWTEYKHCTHPVALFFDGKLFDFMLDDHPVLTCSYKDKRRYDLKQWHSYLMKMQSRGYKVFATLSVRASSSEHEFVLLIPHAPPRLSPEWKDDLVSKS